MNRDESTKPQGAAGHAADSSRSLLKARDIQVLAMHSLASEQVRGCRAGARGYCRLSFSELMVLLHDYLVARMPMLLPQHASQALHELRRVDSILEGCPLAAAACENHLRGKFQALAASRRTDRQGSQQSENEASSSGPAWIVPSGPCGF